MNVSASNFIKIEVKMTNGVCTLLIDSGADISIFKLNKVVGNQKLNSNHRIKLTGITEGETETLATTETELNFGNGIKAKHTFHLVNSDFPILTDGILGRDFLTLFKCNIDYEYWLLNFTIDNITVSLPIQDTVNENYIIPKRCEIIKHIDHLKIKEDMVVFSQEIKPGVFLGNAIISPNNQLVKIMNTTNEPINILKSEIKPLMEPLSNYVVRKTITNQKLSQARTQQIISKIDMTNVPLYAREELKNLITQYSDIFCLKDEPLSMNNFYTQNINVSDTSPVYIPNYKTIHSQSEEIETQIRKMLSDKIIEPSISPFNNPILLVPKKSIDDSKKWRLVVDFRQLNKKILADKFPLPRIDTILDQLGRAKYFSTLDLMAGFHQIPLDENSRKCTAFSTQSGHYQFTRLPFGLNISPNSFQRMISIALAGLTPENAFVYIDDIIVIGCSINQHLVNLTKIFDRMRKYNLKLNLEKCKFFNTEVNYLGHKITDKGILPDISKYETIKNYPIPKNADDVRRFVAFCNYYRKFVPNFATIAHPLNQLLKKKQQFVWAIECQNSFNTLKNFLMSPTLLQYPDFTKTFILTTDASDVGSGAVLSQNINGNDLPIAFASKSFTPGERNKSTILKELTAIHWGINYFKAYLYGRKFIVRTDHRPLVFLFNMKNPTSKLTRMRLDLEEFDFTIEYINGKSNVTADALSRIQMSSDELKSLNTFVVNTRSMTRSKNQNVNTNVNTTLDTNDTNKLEQDNRIDHLAIYSTDNPTETKQLPKIKLEIKNNLLTFSIFKSARYTEVKQLISQFAIYRNESQALELALSLIEEELLKKKIYKAAISCNDLLLKFVPMGILKKLASEILKNIQIIIFKPPTFISERGEIQSIIKSYHELPTSGHVGQHRMYLKLREVYVWKNMKYSIAQYVKSCVLCKKNKITKHTKEKMVVTTTPEKPFEVIAIDTVGPLPKSNQNNRYAVTIQCELTKYIVLVPIPTKEANVIARALVEKFILIYGKFLELKSDQGTEYKNEVLAQICKLLHIKQNFATAYHPQTIGSLERNHRCLNEYLRSFVTEHQSDWDEWMQYYAFNYNTTPHSSHGFTPYELVFGTKAKLPQENYTNKIDPVYNFDLYNKELQFKIQKSNQIARERLLYEKNCRVSNPNIATNTINIKVNDIVYITNENRKKLDSFYLGPYKVIRMEDVNCEIENIQTHNQLLVHKNRLIKA